MTLARSSKYFADVGFWKVQADADDGAPEQVQWRLDCANEEGLTLGGQTLLPKGSVYFNALYSGGVGLERGRITVKEEIGQDFGIFNAKGILAEFKIVGTFEAVKLKEEAAVET